MTTKLYISVSFTIISADGRIYKVYGSYSNDKYDFQSKTFWKFILAVFFFHFFM